MVVAALGSHAELLANLEVHSDRVVVVDHHKTAAAALGSYAELPANLEVHLEFEHSGASLALQHFHPQACTGVHQVAVEAAVFQY